MENKPTNQSAQTQIQEAKPVGYLFNGRFFESIGDVKGHTMYDGNQPIALYTNPSNKQSYHASKLSEVEKRNKSIGEYRRMADYWKNEFNSQVHKCNAIQMELNKAKEEIERLKGRECEHPFAYVQTRCGGEINTCLKCGKDL